MASYENLVAMEPWAFRSGYADSWFPDVFSRETETLTKFLQKSLCDEPLQAAGGERFPVLKPAEETPVGTPSASAGPTVSGGGSENETEGSKRRSVVGPSGKVKKRKSRASKRSTTTYITADAAHFRQMVQQVTGFQLGGTRSCQMPPVAPVLKPEPHRAAVHRLPLTAACLPTLDTSAFLLEQNKPQQQQTADTSASASLLQPTAPPPKMDADASCASAFDFDFFSSFPTLESWKTVM